MEKNAARPSRVLSISLLAEVSHDEAKMRDIFASSGETPASREALDLLWSETKSKRLLAVYTDTR